MQKHAAFYWIVYVIYIDEALFCHVLTRTVYILF